MTPQIQQITQIDKNYPSSIKAYLDAKTPETIWTRGNLDLLTCRQNDTGEADLWAIFCSSKCPGEIILKAHDLAQEFKNKGIPTIGGFHSPIEKECLRVLLRGSQPIIISPARSIENMRIKQDWKKPLAEDRLLIVSIFENKSKQNAQLASKRNAFVAALANKVLIAHAAEGSKTLEFARTLLKWRKPVYTFDSSYNKALLQFGVKPYSEENNG